MKHLVIFALSIFSFSVFAGPECTQEPKEKWKDAKEFEKELRKEYKVKVFKITSGNCYEIYGWNKAGQKIEIYFHPITGKKVKEEIN